MTDDNESWQMSDTVAPVMEQLFIFETVNAAACEETAAGQDNRSWNIDFSQT